MVYVAPYAKDRAQRHDEAEDETSFLVRANRPGTYQLVKRTFAGESRSTDFSETDGMLSTTNPEKLGSALYTRLVKGDTTGPGNPVFGEGSNQRTQHSGISELPAEVSEAAAARSQTDPKSQSPRDADAVRSFVEGSHGPINCSLGLSLCEKSEAQTHDAAEDETSFLVKANCSGIYQLVINTVAGESRSTNFTDKSGMLSTTNPEKLRSALYTRLCEGDTTGPKITSLFF